MVLIAVLVWPSGDPQRIEAGVDTTGTGGESDPLPITGPDNPVEDHTGPHLKVGLIKPLRIKSRCLLDGGWAETDPNDMIRTDGKSAYVCDSVTRLFYFWIYRPKATIVTKLCFYPGYEGKTEAGINGWYLYDRIKLIQVGWGGAAGPEYITETAIPMAAHYSDDRTMPQPLGIHKKYCLDFPEKITDNPIRIKVFGTLPPEPKPTVTPDPQQPGAAITVTPPTPLPTWDHSKRDYPPGHPYEYHIAISKLTLTGYTIK